MFISINSYTIKSKLYVNSNEDKLCTKIVELDMIYNFIANKLLI